MVVDTEAKNHKDNDTEWIKHTGVQKWSGECKVKDGLKWPS